MISKNLRYLSGVEKRILFILTGFISGALIGLLVYYNLTGFFPPIAPMTMLIIGSGIVGLAIQALLFRISSLINRKISWQSQFSLRFGLDFLLNGSITILLSSFVLVIVLISITGYNLSKIWNTYWEGFVTLGILTLVFVILYNIIMLLFFAHFHYAEGQIDDLKQERKQLKLQFEALKNQLSPHYLFNSLNTVSSLLYQDKNAAEEFIRRLAETYQYILSTHRKPLVTLGEELNFVRAYYYLLCVRFKEGLKLDINIPDQLLDFKIPPMTLQILVENAIKHNVFSLNEPLNIYLGVIDNAELRVVNNKTVQPDSVKSTHIGLKNIELRYQYFTSNKITVLDGEMFEVKVPILKNGNSKSAA